MSTLSLPLPSYHRSKRPRSPPNISRPIPADDYRPVSPPMTPPRQRGGSISNPRTWLSRTTSNSAQAAPYAPSKPIRISEPRFMNGFDVIAQQQRSGVLGQGAVVVRTPQEALAGPRCFSPSHDEIQDDAASHEKGSEETVRSQPERPESPPLPPLPDTNIPVCERSYTPSRPTRPPPAVPGGSMSDSMLESSSSTLNLRPSLKTRTPQSSEYSPPVPALPLNLSCTPPQGPFEPILVSSPLTQWMDPAKIMVSLETCTMTYRTTMSTLISRASFLATYLQELIPSRRRESDVFSMRSEMSDAESSFDSIFHRHLASTGVLTHQPPSSIHIFLDRPSAPYAHILTYLRSAPSTPSTPAALPRAVQLTGSQSRLEALLELRDEARFLDLDELYKLCNDELRQRQVRPAALGLHVRGFSSASSASLRSVTTLKDIAEYDEMEREKERARENKGRAASNDSGFASPGKRSKPSNTTPVKARPMSPDERQGIRAHSRPISPEPQQPHPAQRGRTTTRKQEVGLPGSPPSSNWI